MQAKNNQQPVAEPRSLAELVRRLHRALRPRPCASPGAEAKRIGRRLICSQAFLSPCAAARAEGAVPGLRVRLPLTALTSLCALLLVTAVGCGELGHGVASDEPEAPPQSFNQLLAQRRERAADLERRRVPGAARAGDALSNELTPSAEQAPDPDPLSRHEPPSMGEGYEEPSAGLVEEFQVETTSNQAEAMSFDEVVPIGRLASCFPGELDLLQQLVELEHLWALFNGEPAHEPDAGREKITLSIEAADGRLLGSARLQMELIMASALDAPANQLEVFPHPVHLEVPVDLIDAGEFRLSLFVCYDNDQDGACGDEQLGSLSDLAATSGEVDLLGTKPRVYSHVALSASLDNGDLGFELYTGGDAFGATSEDLAALLRNLPPLLFGMDDPLSVLLAARTADGLCADSHEVRTHGCFVAGTRVQVGVGQLVPVELLGRGASVLSYGGVRARVRRAVRGPELLPVVAIATADGARLMVTREHPMLTVVGLKPARALSIADQLLSASGAPTAVSSLSSRSYDGLVYNFELPGTAEADHLVVAEGLVSGDLYLQEQLAKQQRVAMAP